MNINIPLTVEIKATSVSTFSRQTILNRMEKLMYQSGPEVEREQDYLQQLLAREFPEEWQHP